MVRKDLPFLNLCLAGPDPSVILGEVSAIAFENETCKKALMEKYCFLALNREKNQNSAPPNPPYPPKKPHTKQKQKLNQTKRNQKLKKTTIEKSVQN